MELLPFSYDELVAAGKTPSQLDELLLMGGYPALYDRPIAARHWFPAYVTSYVERDVRQLLKVQDLESFQRFVRLCAGRSGQLLNLQSLATDAGVTHNTANAWLSVLEASYVLFLLRPHHVNFNKRLTKSSKLFFHDTGLLCWLLGLQTHGQLSTHPCEELSLRPLWSVNCQDVPAPWGNPRLSFWRDSNGNEVDLLIERAGQIQPVEIKSGQTLNRDFFKGLQRWCALAGELATNPTLIYGGSEAREHMCIHILGWSQINTFS